MAKVIQWKHGTTAENEAFTGQAKEITVDDDLHTLRVHDGETSGGVILAKVSDLPTKLSDLTDDVGVWRADELTNLSQLTNDKGFWVKGTLTKVSQLANDKNYLTGHCSYCTHCTYCQQCSNCHNCTTVNCTTVNCIQVKCTYCLATNPRDCNCDCGDDSCFITGQIKTSRGMVDVHDIRVGDEIISFLGKAVPVVGVSHGHLKGRKAIAMSGAKDFLVTDDHPVVIIKGRKLKFCAAVNGSFDPDKPIKAENGVVGKYSEHNDYLGYFLPMKNLSPDTPTVCPITAEETIIKFGNGYVLIPGVFDD